MLYEAQAQPAMKHVHDPVVNCLVEDEIDQRVAGCTQKCGRVHQMCGSLTMGPVPHCPRAHVYEGYVGRHEGHDHEQHRDGAGQRAHEDDLHQ